MTVRDVGIGDGSLLSGSRLCEYTRAHVPQADAGFAGSDEFTAGVVASSQVAGLVVPCAPWVLRLYDEPIA